MYFIIGNIVIVLLSIAYIVGTVLIFINKGKIGSYVMWKTDHYNVESLLGEIFLTIYDESEPITVRTAAFLGYIIFSTVLAAIIIAILAFIWPLLIVFGIVYFIIYKNQKKKE